VKEIKKISNFTFDSKIFVLLGLFVSKNHQILIFFLVSGENGTENLSERRLVIAEKVNVDVDFYRDVIDLVDTLLYSHQVLELFE
jgi:hypothetical protein